MVRALERTLSAESMLDDTLHSRTDIAALPPITPRDSVGDLLEILRAVRLNNPNVQRIIIEDRALPPLYLEALLRAVANSRFVSHLRLTRVGMNESQADSMALCLQKASALTLVDSVLRHRVEMQ